MTARSYLKKQRALQNFNNHPTEKGQLNQASYSRPNFPELDQKMPTKPEMVRPIPNFPSLEIMAFNLNLKQKLIVKVETSSCSVTAFEACLIELLFSSIGK